MAIHPTAIIDPRAEIDASAEIGPYVFIDGVIRIGARTRVSAHAVILGWTTMGEDNVVHAGSVLGDAPQDKSYDGAESYLEIGHRNILREHTQIHRGTKAGSATVIGDDNMLMATAHVGHNCRVGNEVVIANGSMLGGHVSIGDRAFLGGNCAVHQHVRVGRLAFMRGGSRADKDVPPFAMLDELNIVRGMNRVGLQRAGFSPEQIAPLHRAYRVLFRRRRNLARAVAEIEAGELSDEVRELLEFIRSSQRGMSQGPAGASSPDRIPDGI